MRSACLAFQAAGTLIKAPELQLKGRQVKSSKQEDSLAVLAAEECSPSANASDATRVKKETPCVAVEC